MRQTVEAIGLASAGVMTATAGVAWFAWFAAGIAPVDALRIILGQG